MSYTGTTSYYGIPYGKDGDTIEEPDNQLQSQMIDWLLQAATGIADNGVIDEGVYSQAPDTGAGNLVLLSPVGGVAIRAAFKGALARSNSSIVWEGLSTGSFYYLYIKWASTLYRDPSSFTTATSTTPFSTNNKNYLLLATYDLTGGYPGVLDTNPDNKRYATGFVDHMATKVNPHSEFLTQTNLTVTGSLWVGLDVANTLRIEQPSPSSSVPLMTLVHANTSAPLIYSVDELVVQDLRMTTQLSEVGDNSFDNGKSSIVGAINKNTADIAINTADIATNAGDIATNTADIATNTADIATNAGDIATNTADIALNTNHRLTISGNPHNVISSEVPYDNSGTSLTSTNVKDAITELALWLEECCPLSSSSSSVSDSSSSSSSS